jgi:hypothetical protein
MLWDVRYFCADKILDTYWCWCGMKRIIGGMSYDTETAELLASGEHGHEMSQAWWRLYRTKQGAFFEVAADHDGVAESFHLSVQATRGIILSVTPITSSKNISDRCLKRGRTDLRDAQYWPQSPCFSGCSSTVHALPIRAGSGLSKVDRR